MNPMKWLKLTALMLIAASVLSSGCAKQRVLLIPPGEPVQLAEPVKARIFVTADGERTESDNRVEIPAGWWALPDPGDE
jgi:hypothetical protein